MNGHCTSGDLTCVELSTSTDQPPSQRTDLIEISKAKSVDCSRLPFRQWWVEDDIVDAVTAQRLLENAERQRDEHGIGLVCRVVRVGT